MSVQLSDAGMARLKTKPWKKARRRNSSKQSVKVRIILTLNIIFLPATCGLEFCHNRQMLSLKENPKGVQVC